MKKFFAGFISAIVLMAVCSFTGSFFPNKGESVLKDGVQLYGINTEAMLLPFSYGGKIGFTGKTSSVIVNITPMFDDCVSIDGPFVPVMQNGRWGVVDVSGKTLSKNQPIIKCVYSTPDAAVKAAKAQYPAR